MTDITYHLSDDNFQHSNKSLAKLLVAFQHVLFMSIFVDVLLLALFPP